MIRHKTIAIYYYRNYQFTEYTKLSTSRKNKGDWQKALPQTKKINLRLCEASRPSSFFFTDDHKRNELQ